MKCAKCDGHMCQKNVDGVNVDICGKCSGVWFDFDELEQVLVKDYSETLKNKVQNNSLDDQQRAACPRCGGNGKMVDVQHETHDFHLDTCNVCYGVWLDGGEYELLKGKKNLLATLKKFFSGSDDEYKKDYK